METLLLKYSDIAAHPQHYGYIPEDYKQVLRDVMLPGFPYLIVFEIVEPAEVVVFAIHNTHRNPSRKVRK